MIGAKKRFEVFKRDGFRCQYCWKHSKDVTLEIDHIIPQADWWTDAFNNLITACRECNMGKWKTNLVEWNSKFSIKMNDLYEYIKSEFYRDWHTWIEVMEEEWNQKLDWEIDTKTMWLIATFLQWRLDRRKDNPNMVKELIQRKIKLMERYEKENNKFLIALKSGRPTIDKIRENPSILDGKVAEFYEWWEFFDELTQDFAWDFCMCDCYTEEVFIDDGWNIDDLNKRLNYTISARINEMWDAPWWITKKFSLYPKAEFKEC